MNSNSPNSSNNNCNSGLDNASNIDTNSEKFTVETFGLISWYATGWLSASERARMHKLLNQHPELTIYLEDEQHIIQQLKEDKSVLDLSALESTKKRLKQVMKRIDEIPQENTVQQTSQYSVSQTGSTGTAFSIFKNKVNDFFHALLSGEASTMKYASFASLSVLVALLVAFIAPMINPEFIQQTDTAFHPATVQTTETKKQIATTQLLIGLNESTKNRWLEDLLQKNNATLTKIPGKDGLFRIQFDRKLNANEIESLLNQLNKHKESIWFSGEAY